MKKLNELKREQSGIIASVNGDTRFVSRITSIGITPGCKITIIKNEKHRPLLVYSRQFFGRMPSLRLKTSENLLAFV